MKPEFRFAALLLAPLALAACQGGDKPAQKNTAAGEILEGSVSDAMLPLDTVRSQPPLAPPPTASGKPTAKGSAAADESDATAESSAAASPPPAPTSAAAAEQ